MYETLFKEQSKVHAVFKFELESQIHIKKKKIKVTDISTCKQFYNLKPLANPQDLT